MRKYMIAMFIAMFAVLSVAEAAEYYKKHKGDRRRGKPTEEMALVYVFRPAAIAYAIKTWTFADEQLIGVSKPKGYYFALVPPGKRIIWSKAENTSAIELEIEAGETYYFQTHIKMGFGKARVKLEQIDEARAEKFFGKCSYCEPTDEGRARALEIVANRLDRAGNKVADQKAEDKSEKED